MKNKVIIILVLGFIGGFISTSFAEMTGDQKVYKAIETVFKALQNDNFELYASLLPDKKAIKFFWDTEDFGRDLRGDFMDVDHIRMQWYVDAQECFETERKSASRYIDWEKAVLMDRFRTEEPLELDKFNIGASTFRVNSVSNTIGFRISYIEHKDRLYMFMKGLSCKGEVKD